MKNRKKPDQFLLPHGIPSMSGNEHFHRGYSLRPHKSKSLINHGIIRKAFHIGLCVPQRPATAHDYDERFEPPAVLGTECRECHRGCVSVLPDLMPRQPLAVLFSGFEDEEASLGSKATAVGG